VYELAMMKNDVSIINRIKRSLSIGNFSGLFYIVLFIIDCLFLLFLSTFSPKRNMKKEKNFDYNKYVDYLKKTQK
jgi:hypothetical protein